MYDIFLNCLYSFDNTLFMNPDIAKRAGISRNNVEKKPSVVWNFMKLNTHHNMTIKREFLYVLDVKSATNINTLEGRIKVEKWLLSALLEGKFQKDSVSIIEAVIDKDRHRLQKGYNVSI